jgi:hypothetical protein
MSKGAGVSIYRPTKRNPNRWKYIMNNPSDIQDVRTVNFAEIENRARQLRAQAVKDGFVAFKKALASIQFSFLSKRAEA